MGQAYKGQNANIYWVSGRQDTNERRKEAGDSPLHSVWGQKAAFTILNAAESWWLKCVSRGEKLAGHW